MPRLDLCSVQFRDLDRTENARTSRFRGYGLGFRAQGLGFRVQGLGFRV